MGIRLNDFERDMVRQVGVFMEDSIHVGGYLFGYISARLDQFLKGVITKEQLADDAALVELCKTLSARCTPEQMRQIADGTRELPGEDVQSGH